MPLLSRIYYHALFGALGGLFGWMLFGVFGDKEQPNQSLLGGSLLGGLIGYLLGVAEALCNGSWVRFCRLASYGVVLGAFGGAAGMWLGDWVNYALVGLLGADREGSGLHYVATLLARGLGWAVLGVGVGAGKGITGRSLTRILYGTLGGLLGGFVGGTLFALLYSAGIDRPEGSAEAVGGASGLMILGACIGGLSALVQSLHPPASVRVLRGWHEGREYPLLKPNNVLGRDEYADIALFRDQQIQKQHAVIRYEGGRYVLCNTSPSPEQTRVNDRPVIQTCELRDGDRIQLGGVVLRFQQRQTRASSVFDPSVACIENWQVRP